MYMYITSEYPLTSIKFSYARFWESDEMCLLFNTSRLTLYGFKIYE